jgi:hypothetical protein
MFMALGATFGDENRSNFTAHCRLFSRSSRDYLQKDHPGEMPVRTEKHRVGRKSDMMCVVEM